MDQGWTDRAHFSIRSPDRSTTNERWFDQNNLFDLIVDLIDTFQFAIKFPINLRHLLRRKFIKFCISKNLSVILLEYVKILRPIIRCSFSQKGIKTIIFKKCCFFGVDGVDFGGIDDQDLIGSMIGIRSEFLSKIWSVIGSGNLFLWKIGIGAENEKNLIMSSPEMDEHCIASLILENDRWVV
jgi:hypothetical protein